MTYNNHNVFFWLEAMLDIVPTNAMYKRCFGL